MMLFLPFGLVCVIGCSPSFCDVRFMRCCASEETLGTFDIRCHVYITAASQISYVDLYQRFTLPVVCRIYENPDETKLPFKDLCFRIPDEFPTKDAWKLTFRPIINFSVVKPRLEISNSRGKGR
jgi:hypothetical protein